MIVGALFDFLAEVVGHAFGWRPAFEVFVEVVADDFVGSEDRHHVFDARA